MIQCAGTVDRMFPVFSKDCKKSPQASNEWQLQCHFIYLEQWTKAIVALVNRLRI